MRVLVAEKPSVARQLATFLGARNRVDGAIEGNGWQVTWALGHLTELKRPDEYDPTLKRWSLESLPFVPERFELTPSRNQDASARKQLETAARLCREADQLVCATDAGREGELIFRYLLEYADCSDRAFDRLWLTSLTDTAIRDAFDSMRPGSEWDNLHHAARSRSEADWLVGINATRAYTVRYGGGRVLWSVGRVQTPVLTLIALRDDEIRAFDARPFQELRTKYRDVLFKDRGERFFDPAAAQAALEAVTGQDLEIESVDEKEERAAPPLLHDLTSLQRELNLRHGLSAARTLELAQQLYEKRFLTYPRTDSRHLTPDMFEPIRTTLRNLQQWNAEALTRVPLDDLPQPKRVFDAAKVSDHHAIVPTGQVPKGLDSESQWVFDTVARRLVQAFLPDRVQRVTTVDARVDAAPGPAAGAADAPPPEPRAFRARGVRVLDPGWAALEPKSASPPKKGKRGSETEEPQELPAFTAGETGPHQPELHEGSTKPPRPYTENTLLGVMETAGKLVDDEELREAMKARGLGTPATRASILEVLIRRGYVRREKKALRVTDLGRYLVGVIRDPLLKSAELTGDWEHRLQQVEGGALTREAFMAEIVEYTGALVGRVAPPVLSRDGLGLCPRCEAEVIEGARGFGCSAWESGCSFVLWKEYRGVALNASQVRELLARRILLRPVQIEDTPRILCLTDTGAVIDLELPSAAAQDKRRAGSRKGRSSTRQTSRSQSRNGQPSTNATPTPTKSASTATPPQCPACRVDLVEGQRGYGCGRWREGCRFVVWKEIAGKKVTKTVLRTLLDKGKTRLATGFRTEAGAACRGRLILDGQTVRAELEAGEAEG